REITLPGHAKHVTNPVNDELVDQNFGGRPRAVVGAHPAAPVACRSLLHHAASARREQNRLTVLAGAVGLAICSKKTRLIEQMAAIIAGAAPHVAGSTETTWKVCMWPSSPRIETYSPVRKAWLPKR